MTTGTQMVLEVKNKLTSSSKWEYLDKKLGRSV